jgi:hypothetical protein
MALPAAEIINETMWVVYYAIAKKSPLFIVIDLFFSCSTI